MASAVTLQTTRKVCDKAVGGTGSVGRLVVDQAVRDGNEVRVLTREPARHRFPQAVEVVKGDISSPETLLSAVEGIDAVVFTHGTYGGDHRSAERVDFGGVRNVLEALCGRRVRIVLMTTIGVTDRKGAHDWKRRAERLVRQSGCDYTIVRPGWFDYNGPDEQRLVLLQGDRRQSGTPRDGSVSRTQLAEMLVHCLMSKAAVRKTFELVTEEGSRAGLDALLAATKADPVNSVDGVDDMRNMPLETA